MRFPLFVAAFLAMWVVASCVIAPVERPAESDPQLPNPASSFCVDQGFELQIRDEADGQVGYCVFPDGSECEEWAFYREECAIGDNPGGD